MKAIVDKTDSEIRILSPAVGKFFDMPEEGTPVAGGSKIGKIRILNTEIPLLLPEGISGVVHYLSEPDFEINVSYKDELLRLRTDEIKFAAKQKSAGENKFENLENDGFLVRAFTTGIFYRRPSPDAEPYVEEGQKIEKGKVLGLIEVMKTFNHIVFQGTENSDTGIVKKILVEDGQEVQLNQPLFLVG